MLFSFFGLRGVLHRGPGSPKGKRSVRTSSAARKHYFPATTRQSCRYGSYSLLRLATRCTASVCSKNRVTRSRIYDNVTVLYGDITTGRRVRELPPRSPASWWPLSGFAISRVTRRGVYTKVTLLFAAISGQRWRRVSHLHIVLFYCVLFLLTRKIKWRRKG